MNSMHHYRSQISWQRDAQPFLDSCYRRRHLIRFDGVVEMPASSSPHVVPDRSNNQTNPDLGCPLPFQVHLTKHRAALEHLQLCINRSLCRPA